MFFDTSSYVNACKHKVLKAYIFNYDQLSYTLFIYLVCICNYIDCAFNFSDVLMFRNATRGGFTTGALI